MAKPTSRVLAALDMLQTGGRIRGAELATRLGVDARTVRRYIAQLVDLGIPVESERGCDGGYALRAGYRLPPMMFGPDETLAVAVGLRAAAQLGLEDIAPALAAVQAKLERVLPRGVRERLGEIERSVALDLARPRASGSASALRMLSAATHARQRVRLNYAAADGVSSQREFDPYGVAFRGGQWYVVGHCRLRDALRAFRLDRIGAVEPLPASFGRPEHFDVLAYLTDAVATLPRQHAVEVLLRTDLAAARAHIAPELATLTQTGQGVRLLAQTDSLAWMARVLAALPWQFDIVRPAALRKELAAHARQLLAGLDAHDAQSDALGDNARRPTPARTSA